MKKKLLLGASLGAVSVLGVFVGLCGIGLSLGLRKLSVICFFSTLVLLAALRLGVILLNRKNEMKSGY